MAHAPNNPRSPTGVSTLHCVKCDYNVTGLTSGVCPSCGTRFAPEADLPPRQLDQPSFLHGLLVLYLLTGPGALLALLFQSPVLLIGVGLCAVLAQPTCALLLGVAYGSRLTAHMPRVLRILACIGLMLAMLAVSYAAWYVTMSKLGHSLTGLSQRPPPPTP